MKTARGPILILCVVAIGIMIITGCSGNSEQSLGEKQLKFIFITTCVEEEFFKPVIKGMEDAARMMNVHALFTGTTGVDIQAQADMVRKAVEDGYDGIALNIIDPEGFDEAVRYAMDKGVPVVSFNVDDHNTSNARLSAVCQSFHDAGRTLGKKSLEFIPGGSTVLLTMHAEGVSALEDRLHGIQAEIEKKNISWKVAITGNSGEESEKVITEALEANPDIKYVLCTGQADTEGAGLAIEKHFKGYSSAGFDLNPKILEMIRDGYVKFTIDQQPYVQGFYPVVQLALYCKYSIKPSSMDAGAGIIDRQNVDQVTNLCGQKYR